MVLSEDILKIKYRKEPFDVFEIEKGTLLTPSAKQFLNEKGIELLIKEEKPLVSTKNKEDNIEAEEKIFYEKPKYVDEQHLASAWSTLAEHLGSSKRKPSDLGLNKLGRPAADPPCRAWNPSGPRAATADN